MSATDDLADACARVGLNGPSRRGAWLGDVLAGVAGALGSSEGEAVAARDRLGLEPASRAVVVLVDGLGRLNLAERAGHAPFLRGLLAGSRRVRSTFPSTTATAMGAFGTGQAAGRTGMLGYTVRVPATGALANLVSWTDLPEPEVWQPAPTWFARLRADGVSVTSVGPGRFHGSGLTRAALRGAEYRAAESLADRVDGVLEVLRRPGLAYLYWGDVDKVGHHAGWTSPEWGHAVEAVDAELGRLARSLPRDTLMVVTADHGMVDVDPGLRWDVAQEAELAREVELVAGEPRAMQLHLSRDADPGLVAGRWREVLGRAALVVTRDEAVDGGLFGPVDPRVRPVIGDLVVAMSGRATVVDSRTQTPASIGLLGVHGSLTDLELAVPLLVTRD